MGGMPSTNAPGYAPQQSPAPAAGGKMPVSQSQYGPPQQGAGRAGSVGQQRMADAIHRMLPADGRGAFVGQERMADAMRSMMPASSQPQQNPQASRPMSPSQIARQQALAAQAAGTPLSQEQQLANLQQAMTQSQQQPSRPPTEANIRSQMEANYNQAMNDPNFKSLPQAQQDAYKKDYQNELSRVGEISKNQMAQYEQQRQMQQSMPQQAGFGQGQNIPQDVMSRYNQVNQPSQGPGGYGTQQQAPFQTQQMLNNVQQGTGALGQMGQQGAVGLGQYVGAGQQGYPQQGYPQQSAMPNDYYAVSGAPNQFSTGQSSNPSQLFGQFNQAQGMGQGQQQQGYGSQSAGQPSGGFMSGTGGGTTGGGGMSRGKGFRSGGAVNNIRLSNDDVRRILNALATAREVVKNGK